MPGEPGFIKKETMVRMRMLKKIISDTSPLIITTGKPSTLKLINLPVINRVKKTIGTNNNCRNADTAPSRQKKLMPKNNAPKSPLREFIPTARVSIASTIIENISGMIKNPSPKKRKIRPTVPDNIRNTDSILLFVSMFFIAESRLIPSSSG